QLRTSRFYAHRAECCLGYYWIARGAGDPAIYSARGESKTQGDSGPDRASRYRAGHLSSRYWAVSNDGRRSPGAETKAGHSRSLGRALLKERAARGSLG